MIKADRIIIDGRLLRKKNTGISRYSRELIGAYVRKYGRDEILVIVAPGFGEPWFEYCECKLNPFRIKDYLLFSFFIRKLDGGIYHSLFYSNGFLKDKHKKYIMTVHDVMYRILPDFFSPIRIVDFIAVCYYNFIVGKSIKNSDEIISVSETTRNDVISFWHKESFVIPEGVNQLGDFSRPVSGVEKGKFFLYVGNNRRHKNLETLVLAFLKAKTNYALVICGNNYKVSNSMKRIKVTGYIEEPELVWLYKNCAACVIPSLYEGFGLPILEALQNGAKVIASNGGALAEYPKEAVMSFSPLDVDELAVLMEKVDEFKRNESIIQDILKSYTWDKYFTSLFIIIDSLQKRRVVL